MLLLWSSCDSLKMKKIRRPFTIFRGRQKYVLLTVIGSKGCTGTAPADDVTCKNGKEILCCSCSIVINCHMTRAKVCCQMLWMWSQVSGLVGLWPTSRLQVCSLHSEFFNHQPHKSFQIWVRIIKWKILIFFSVLLPVHSYLKIHTKSGKRFSYQFL